ncbi:MAG: pilus assembly PilX N-terminal domain-containing protein, partial [Planctomycetota bacterium]|nr:pilus assembly PilX N-terminal domain-containing protein [Planctomycetota bacterium]
MRLKGSVLIVVLGLLAVLAVVGVAFVTMSSIESNTSANFALQAQFDLAADGAVDYVCQALIRDVWEFNTDPAYTSTSYRAYTGYMLTGKFGTQHYDWPDPVIPAALNTVTPIQDAFLATTWSSGDPSTVMPTTTAYSFRAPVMTLSPKPYLLNTWLNNSSGTPYTSPTNTSTSVTVDVSPNNLGIPDTDKGVKWWRPPNGLWIPELSFPYESGPIRCSVTVQDHAAMVNLNAHGAPPVSTGWTPYGKAAGKGFFVSDLSPAGATWLPGFTDITQLLDGTRTPAPGRYGTANTPGNKRLGDIFIQNPTITGTGTSSATDRPFTLDDEFELRRLSGTYAKSRLEQIIGTALDSTPSTTTTAKVAARMGLTTVGWNAEVIPGAGIGMTPKCDINLAGTAACPVGILSAMYNGCVLDNTSGTGLPNIASQFSANVQAFKNRGKSGSNYFKTYDGKYGARRQVFLSKISAKVQVNYPDATHDTWTVRAQVFNPWYGSYAGDTASGIDTSNTTVNFEFSGGTETIAVGGAPKLVTNRQTWDTTSKVFTKANGGSLPKITLKDSPGIIDQIDSSAAGYGSIGAAATIKKRPFGVYDEPRGTGDTDSTCIVTVL